jgi:hypothetical protein
VRLYRVEFSHSQGHFRKSVDVRRMSPLPQKAEIEISKRTSENDPKRSQTLTANFFALLQG